MVPVSVIIVNYNTLDLLINCIDSIYKQTKDITFEIIVVDNNSNICPIEPLKKLFKDVIVLKSEINLGFGKANNLGAEYAKGKYLLFLNSDTILINNSINIFHNFLEENKKQNIGAVGGNLYTLNNTPNYSYSMYFPSISRIIKYRLRLSKLFKDEFYNDTKEIKKVKIIIGADLFISKEIFLEVGKFDPFYFMYIEDGDLQFQLYKNKYNVYNIPHAKIMHLQGASSTTGDKMIMEFNSYYYFFKKNNSIHIKYIYVFIEIIFSILFYLFFKIFLDRNKKNNYKKLINHIFNECIFKKNNL